jgi:hypothetical protein
VPDGIALIYATLLFWAGSVRWASSAAVKPRTDSLYLAVISGVSRNLLLARSYAATAARCSVLANVNARIVVMRSYSLCKEVTLRLCLVADKWKRRWRRIVNVR